MCAMYQEVNRAGRLSALRNEQALRIEIPVTAVDDSAVSVSVHPMKGVILVASRTLDRGSVLTTAVSYEAPADDIDRIAATDLYKYVFYPPGTSNARDRKGYIAFGPVSLCSHSETPNARVAWTSANGVTFIELRAVEPIPKGAEITMRYSNIEEYPGHEHWI